MRLPGRWERPGAPRRWVLLLILLVSVPALAASPQEILEALRRADYPGAARLAREGLTLHPPGSPERLPLEWGLGRSLYSEARLLEQGYRAAPRLLALYREKALAGSPEGDGILAERLALLEAALPVSGASVGTLVLPLPEGRRATMPDPLAAGVRARVLYAEAAEVLTEVAQAWDRARPQALLLAGRCRLALGEPREAVEALRGCGLPEARPDLLEALVAAGSSEEADCMMAQPSPAAQVCRWLLAGVRTRRLAPRAALEGLPDMTGAEPSPPARLAAAEVARLAGDADLALAMLEGGYDRAGRDDLSRNDPELMLQRAMALFRQGIHAYPEATASLLALAERFPELGTLHQAAQGIYAAEVRRGGDQKLQDGT